MQIVWGAPRSFRPVLAFRDFAPSFWQDRERRSRPGFRPHNGGAPPLRRRELRPKRGRVRPYRALHELWDDSPHRERVGQDRGRRSEDVVSSARPVVLPDHFSGQDYDEEREEEVTKDAF